LKAAGLRRVNIGLSSLEVDTYRRIACADIEPALAGLDAAIEAGLDPVKINIVLVRGINDGEIASFVALARTRPVEVRFIERMPFGGADSTVPSAEVRQRIEAEARIALGEARVTPTALVYRPAGFAGSVGTISPLSDPFCGRCDRLRVTSAGVARACLAEQHGIDIAGAARAGATDQELARLLLDAFECKPAGHRGRFDGLMRSVGG
jgi:cyclic pyranopterin phosphate synthase